MISRAFVGFVLLCAGALSASGLTASPAPAKTPAEQTLPGPEGRVAVTDTTVYPYSAIGELVATFPDRKVRCTGTMIGPRHVLTAAHCIFDVATRQPARRVTFTPGRVGKKAPFGVFVADRSIPALGFTARDSTVYGYLHMVYDIGVVVLKEDAGDRLGWLDYAVDPGREPFVGNVVAYPVDKRDTMWRSSCTIDPDSNGFLDYACPTLPGTSGAGVYEFDEAANRAVIYAVNIGGNVAANTGLRISADYYCWLKSIVEDRDACAGTGLDRPPYRQPDG